MIVSIKHCTLKSFFKVLFAHNLVFCFAFICILFVGKLNVSFSIFRTNFRFETFEQNNQKSFDGITHIRPTWFRIVAVRWFKQRKIENDPLLFRKHFNLGSAAWYIVCRTHNQIPNANTKYEKKRLSAYFWTLVMGDDETLYNFLLCLPLKLTDNVIYQLNVNVKRMLFLFQTVWNGEQNKQNFYFIDLVFITSVTVQMNTRWYCYFGKYIFI